jgi:hypothetical protein
MKVKVLVLVATVAALFALFAGVGIIVNRGGGDGGPGASGIVIQRGGGPEASGVIVIGPGPRA